MRLQPVLGMACRFLRNGCAAGRELWVHNRPLHRRPASPGLRAVRHTSGLCDACDVSTQWLAVGSLYSDAI